MRPRVRHPHEHREQHPVEASPAPVADLVDHLGGATSTRPSAQRMASGIHRRRVGSVRRAPPRRRRRWPVSTSTSRSSASARSATEVSSKKRSTPKASRSGQDAVSTATRSACAPSGPRRPHRGRPAAGGSPRPARRRPRSLGEGPRREPGVRASVRDHASPSARGRRASPARARASTVSAASTPPSTSTCGRSFPAGRRPRGPAPASSRRPRPPCMRWPRRCPGRRSTRPCTSPPRFNASASTRMSSITSPTHTRSTAHTSPGRRWGPVSTGLPLDRHGEEGWRCRRRDLRPAGDPRQFLGEPGSNAARRSSRSPATKLLPVAGLRADADVGRDLQQTDAPARPPPTRAHPRPARPRARRTGRASRRSRSTHASRLGSRIGPQVRTVVRFQARRGGAVRRSSRST